MTPSTDWPNFRKTLLGVSLIVGPLLLLISDAMTSGLYDGDNEVRYLADIADNKALYYAGNLVGAIGAVFLVGVVVALVHLVRVRKPRYAVVTGGLALLGVLTMSGVWLTFTIVELAMAKEPNREAMAALMRHSDDGGAMAPLLVTFLGTILGLFLLAIGLLLARTVPRWMPVVIIVGAIVLFVADDALGPVASIVLVAAFAPLGWRILHSSVEDWEAGNLAPPPAGQPLVPEPPPAAPA